MGAPRQIARSEDDVRRDLRSRATGQLIFGAALLLLGIIITAATYGSASTSGGSYIIAYGPIGVGIIMIIRGIGGMSS